jgi:hypothetical protein
MGCSNTMIFENRKELQQSKINLTFTSNHLKKELQHAQVIISLITKIRNRIIYLYHKIIYSSAACIYDYPSITFALRNIFYKISADFKGDLLASNLTYIEDPPYLQCRGFDLLSEQAKEKLQEIFDFIVEIRGYKQIIKQIDKDTPELLFLVFENKEFISEENCKKINESMNLFKEMVKLRYNILESYKNQIYNFVTKTEFYCKNINRIGREAFKRGYKDIFEIALLKKNEIIDENQYKIKEIVISGVIVGGKKTENNKEENSKNKDSNNNINNNIEEEIKFKDFDMSEIETIKRRMENTLKNDIKEEFNNNNLINELE